MKFLKLTLLTTLLFTAFVIIFSNSSCERNACNNVTCFNGGSCNKGICRCELGYEGPQCQTLSTSRYIGGYAGYTECDNGAQTIDSVFITQDTKAINYVYVAFKSILPKSLHGYVSSNESTYSILIPSDSINNGVLKYLKVYTVTLQNDKSLSLHTYETDYRQLAGPDTIIHKCDFFGTKY
jgi:hypothetical protein